MFYVLGWTLIAMRVVLIVGLWFLELQAPFWVVLINGPASGFLIIGIIDDHRRMARLRELEQEIKRLEAEYARKND